MSGAPWAASFAPLCYHGREVPPPCGLTCDDESFPAPIAAALAAVHFAASYASSTVAGNVCSGAFR